MHIKINVYTLYSHLFKKRFLMLKCRNKTWAISKFIPTCIIYHIFYKKIVLSISKNINPLICFHRYCDKIWSTSFIVVHKTSQKLQYDLVCNPVCTTLLSWQQGANAWKFVLWNFFTKFCRDPYVRFHDEGCFLTRISKTWWVFSRSVSY